jgi:hypothetical protein
MAFQCSVDIPKVSGLEDQHLTVGREFFLTCKGDWPKNLNQDNLSFIGDVNFKYQLRLLSFEFRSPEAADLKVTSYLAGQHRLPKVVLTDGSQQIELGPVEFQVQSVIQPGEKAEPYGPFGPAVIPIPALYWIFLLAVLGAMGSLIGLRIWRFNQRRAMLERLKEHDSALNPLQEFHQSMRKLQRANPVFYGKEATAEELRQGIEELARMFKVYVSRRLRVPAFEWTERLILKDIRRYHLYVYDEYSRKIHDLFNEFRKAQHSSTKLHEKDVSQLADSVRKALEGIENLMNKEDVAEKKARGRR